MSAMASQITSLTIVYWTIYSGADQRKHQSSASLAFVRGIHRWPVNSSHKRPVTRKMFPFDDVLMTDGFPAHSPVIKDFGDFFAVIPNTSLNKQSSDRCNQNYFCSVLTLRPHVTGWALPTFKHETKLTFKSGELDQRVTKTWFECNNEKQLIMFCYRFLFHSTLIPIQVTAHASCSESYVKFCLDSAISTEAAEGDDGDCK